MQSSIRSSFILGNQAFGTAQVLRIKCQKSFSKRLHVVHKTYGLRPLRSCWTCHRPAVGDNPRCRHIPAPLSYSASAISRRPTQRDLRSLFHWTDAAVRFLGPGWMSKWLTRVVELSMRSWQQKEKERHWSVLFYARDTLNEYWPQRLLPVRCCASRGFFFPNEPVQTESLTSSTLRVTFSLECWTLDSDPGLLRALSIVVSAASHSSELEKPRSKQSSECSITHC